MRLVQFAPIIAFATAAIVAAPAYAQVEARISADFQKKLEKDYGVREAEVLKTALTRHVESAMASAGQKPARIVVTIEDAKPNRPTFEQLGAKPGLSSSSISIGGAEVSGIAYDASGKEIATYNYDWYETDITQAATSTTWTDARWVFARFAKRFADKLG
jgi:hypothetical protein